MSFGPSYNISVHFPDGININLPASSDRELAGLLKQILDQLQEQKQMATAMDAKLASLADEVAQLRTVEQSAVTFIKGIPALIAAAVADAKAAGATDQQLQSVTDLGTSVDVMKNELAAALTANTPADTTTGTGGSPTTTDSGPPADATATS